MKLIFPVVLIMAFGFFSSCTKTDGVVVHINCDGLVTDTAGTNDNGRVYIPNAFTPNGDGLNEIYRPITQNIDSIKFTIYDENNKVVFTTDVLGDGWVPLAAPILPIQKYYYKIQATTSSNKKIGVCGSVFALTCYSINPPKSFYYFEDMLTPGGFTGPTAETLSNCP